MAKKRVPASAPKTRIEHSVYGLGTVVEADDRYTTIDFDEAGTRKFVTRMVKMTPSDTPAPTRRVRKKKVAKSEPGDKPAAAKRARATKKKKVAAG